MKLYTSIFLFVGESSSAPGDCRIYCEVGVVTQQKYWQFSGFLQDVSVLCWAPFSFFGGAHILIKVWLLHPKVLSTMQLSLM